MYKLLLLLWMLAVAQAQFNMVFPITDAMQKPPPPGVVFPTSELRVDPNLEVVTIDEEEREEQEKLKLTRELNNIHNVDDLFKLINFTPPSPLPLENQPQPEVLPVLTDSSIDMPFGESETSGVGVRIAQHPTTPAPMMRMAEPAGCELEEEAVAITDNSDPNVILWPACTRVKRCRGCCSHDLLTCEPSQVQTKTFRIVRMEYVNGQASFRGYDEIGVLEHLNCLCGCRIKEHNCTAWQYYNEDGCRCECSNIADKNKCQKQQNQKFWDSRDCSCKCKKDSLCSSGYQFSHDSCRCQPIPGYRLSTPATHRRSSDLLENLRWPPYVEEEEETLNVHEKRRHNRVNRVIDNDPIPSETFDDDGKPVTLEGDIRRR